MARKMEIHWWKPLKLTSGKREGLIYSFPSLEELPDHPGVYVFGRMQGRSHFVPIYIGKAENLHRRIRSQLNNVRLMVALQREPARQRLLAIGQYVGGPGTRANRAIQVAERILIEHALAEGHQLLNQQGTRRPQHEIAFTGSRKARDWLPRALAAPARR